MVQTIEIKGKERSVSFGPAMLIAFENETGINFFQGDYMQEMNVATLGKLAYLALKYGALINGEDFDHEEEKVMLWFPTMESLTQVINLFSEAMPDQSEEAEKKLKRVK